MPPPSDRGDGEAEPRSSSAPARRRRPARRHVVLLLVGLFCLLVLVFAYQATRTALALYRAKQDVSRLTGQVQAQNATAARATLSDLERQAAVAHAHSGNVLWRAAGIVPWIGTDVDAVRTASAALDDTARSALPAALQIYQSVQSHHLRSADGRFDTRAIAALEPRFVRLAAGVLPSQRSLDAVNADDVKLGPLRTATRDFQSQLDSLATLAQAGTTATQLLPGMLGGSGPRTYLLVEQSNAEIRATGGLPGSFSVVDVRDGRIHLGRQVSDLDFPTYPRPVVPLTKDELAMHGTQMGVDVRAANVTPDVPRAAQIVDAMYARTFGRHVDGVVFVDPFVLSALLQVTGPVTVGSETFHAGDVARKLLNTVYLRYPQGPQQNAYFASAAKGIFDVLSTRPVNQLGVLRALTPMAEQRRFLVWSRHPAEQSLLARTTIAGALPHGAAGGAAAGMYLSGATSAKMEYYLDYVGGVRSLSCSSDGTQRFQVRLRMKSNAPTDVSGLPDYVVGNGSHAP
ncbi:MAG: DUF4012 domain-containing protein, partial [Marmoricola sp.]|nr:DUF4012 domain-containing protein [Marmoricola sp.]